MKLISHLCTITRHRHLVMKLCKKVGLGVQRFGHDLSKYSIAELRTGAKYYNGHKSPNSIERSEKGYSDAWLHHKGRNKHHYEYWYDSSAVDQRYIPVPMPINYLLESFCDRVAACKVYLKDKYTDKAALEYYLVKNDGANMHPKSAQVLSDWLTLLAEKGEEQAFGEIKAQFAQWKKQRKNKDKTIFY